MSEVPLYARHTVQQGPGGEGGSLSAVPLYPSTADGDTL